MQLSLNGILNLTQGQLEQLAAIGFDPIWDEHQTMSEPLPSSGHAIRTVVVELDCGDSNPLDHGREIGANVTFSKGGDHAGVTVTFPQHRLETAVVAGLATLGFHLNDPGLRMYYDPTDGASATVYVEIPKVWRERESS